MSADYIKTTNLTDVTLWIQHEFVKHPQPHLINHSQLIPTMPNTIMMVMVNVHYELVFELPAQFASIAMSLMRHMLVEVEKESVECKGQTTR